MYVCINICIHIHAHVYISSKTIATVYRISTKIQYTLQHMQLLQPTHKKLSGKIGTFVDVFSASSRAARPQTVCIFLLPPIYQLHAGLL